jgi:hypothetical protein
MRRERRGTASSGGDPLHSGWELKGFRWGFGRRSIAGSVWLGVHRSVIGDWWCFHFNSEVSQDSQRGTSEESGAFPLDYTSVFPGYILYIHLLNPVTL